MRLTQRTDPTRRSAREPSPLRMRGRSLTLIAALGLSMLLLCMGLLGEGPSAPQVVSVQLPSAAPQLTEGAVVEVQARAEVTLRASLGAERGLPSLRGLMRESLTFVEAQLGISFTRPITVTLTPDASSMRRLAQEEQGWAPPEWANGLAYPKKRQIYLHMDHPAALERTLRHELAHVALADLKRLPLWLNEGVAVWTSERVSFERMRTLAQARLTGELLPISTLSRAFPSSPTRAQLAYAQSAHFVTHLADEHGAESLKGVLQDMRAGVTLREASERRFERPLHQLEARWRAQLTHGRLEGLSSLAQEGVPLALGLALTFMISLPLALWRRLSGRLEVVSLDQASASPPEQLAGVRLHQRAQPTTPPRGLEP